MVEQSVEVRIQVGEIEGVDVVGIVEKSVQIEMSVFEIVAGEMGTHMRK